ncbi:hypothetical protein C6A37_07680 [Desulfobacteraceae bacterium SEEP-SAG9]|nr:hypothetical protein C6A37_07680 [Desulfobacteraceae bacterium SEEP-SAG9]
MYRPEFTRASIDEEFDMFVLNLVEIMALYWEGDDPYPGDPHNHNLFKQNYSDHNPIAFRIKH